MANLKKTVSENRYGVEIDGIGEFKASKVTIGEDKHDPAKVTVGNRNRPYLGRGNVEPQETSITIPSGLYDGAIKALSAWIQRYNSGADTTPKSARVIVYDDRGKTPIETHELIDCVPISLKADDKSGDNGSNSSTVTMTILPDEVKTT